MITVSVVITNYSKWITKNGAQPQNNGIVLEKADIKKEAKSQGKESNRTKKPFTQKMFLLCLKKCHGIVLVTVVKLKFILTHFFIDFQW